eukprot:TRINITY_DN22356_c0_g1_i3.p1 TRINITY_DN22356_c0_g1~~TRINITY_DN22356_c0_g1_i3.p1  ORF type:complete len:249 (+),score=34.66 TRINITY_DN22356_c0_g1_i3:470-1216(+)
MDRKRRLHDIWGFDCRCKRCLEEMQTMHSPLQDAPLMQRDSLSLLGRFAATLEDLQGDASEADARRCVDSCCQALDEAISTAGAAFGCLEQIALELLFFKALLTGQAEDSRRLVRSCRDLLGERSVVSCAAALLEDDRAAYLRHLHARAREAALEHGLEGFEELRPPDFIEVLRLVREAVCTRFRARPHGRCYLPMPAARVLTGVVERPIAAASALTPAVCGGYTQEQAAPAPARVSRFKAQRLAQGR